MAREVEVSRAEDGGNSNEKSGTGKKIEVKEKQSEKHMGGVKSKLKDFLGGQGATNRSNKNPNRYVVNMHKTPRAEGAHYNPMGEFGHIEGPQTPAVKFEIHMNQPGKNALGDYMNTVGKNALPKGRY